MTEKIIKIYDTSKGEYPDETGMYLIKYIDSNINNNYKEITIFFFTTYSNINFAYYRKELNAFFDERERILNNLLWCEMPL